MQVGEKPAESDALAALEALLGLWTAALTASVRGSPSVSLPRCHFLSQKQQLCWVKAHPKGLITIIFLMLAPAAHGSFWAGD